MLQRCKDFCKREGHYMKNLDGVYLASDKQRAEPSVSSDGTPQCSPSIYKGVDIALSNTEDLDVTRTHPDDSGTD